MQEDSQIPSTRMDANSLEQLAAELAKLGEKTFRKKYNHPFLLVEFSPPSEHEWLDPKTLESDSKELDEFKTPKLLRAIAVVKSDRNAYQSKITLGRAKNNDIIIREAKISKLHLAITPQRRNYSLTDMGSANGTFINGVRLNKNESVKLKSGDKIGLWRFVFTFYELDFFLHLLLDQAKEDSLLPID